MAASQETQVRPSETYDATLDNTQAETTPASLQDDLNFIRTLLRKIINGTGNWYDTPATDLATLAADTTPTDLATHTGDATIHFTEASIDHANISNIGTNDHATIDAHLASTANPHSVTPAQIGAADAVHTHVAADVTDFAATVDPLVTANAAVVANTAKVSADGLLDTHSDVDTSGPNFPSIGEALTWDGISWKPALPSANPALAAHLADATIHFTEASIDHLNILNAGTNTHAQIDAHIADTLNPHSLTPASIGAAPASHNHVAADITDFDAAVSGAPAVVANTVKVSADGSIDTHSDVSTSGINVPSFGDILYWDNTCWRPTAPGAGGPFPLGDVSGPGTGNSTDNAIARWDTNSGTILQNSNVLLTDPSGGVVTFQGGAGITLAFQSDVGYPLELRHSNDGSVALSVSAAPGGSVVIHDLLRSAAGTDLDISTTQTLNAAAENILLTFNQTTNLGTFTLRDVGGAEDIIFYDADDPSLLLLAENDIVLGPTSGNVVVDSANVQVEGWVSGTQFRVIDWQPVPAAVSNYAQLFVDPADGITKIRKSTGDGGGLVDLEDSGGDVFGPASSTALRIPVFADATGKLLAQSDFSITGTTLGSTGDLTVAPALSLNLYPVAGSVDIQAGPGDYTRIRHADTSIALEVTPTAGGSVVVHDLFRPNAANTIDMGSSALPFKRATMTEFHLRDQVAGVEADMRYSHGAFISSNGIIDPTPVGAGFGAGYGDWGFGTFTQPIGNLLGFNVGCANLFVGNSLTFDGAFLTFGITHPNHLEVADSFAPSDSIFGPFELGAFTTGGRWGNVLAHKYTLEEGLSAPGAVPGFSQLYMSPTNEVTVIKGNGSIVNLELGAGGGSGLQLASQQFTPALLQEDFVISQAPAGRTIMFVNGLELFENDGFTVAGTTVSFDPIAAGYTLDTNDIVDIYYEV